MATPISSTGRLEAFSDGVFAIAITLLILEVKVVPHARDGDLARRLGEQWPSYVAYVLTFVGIVVGHRAGVKFRRPAEIAGGVILILIGTRILFEHLGIL